MAGHLYGFGAAQSAAASGLSSIYAAAANSRALTEPYFPASLASSDPSNYPAATAMFLSHTDPYASHLTSLASWHSAAAAAADDASAAGIKRSSEGSCFLSLSFSL